MSSEWSYEIAIRKLMSLQSSASVRAQLVRNRIAGKPVKSTVDEMAKLLPRIGIPLSRLDELSVIHVAGTKGKGSTCSMCESILRAHGLRTGFFSGPHLVHPRERIRLDGRPLPERAFATRLQRLYTILEDTREDGAGMPNFFMVMTLLAFHVFLEEAVDVAIVEVGVGGVDDATNVLRNVCVVGITSLELDHTNVLGNTLAEVAAAKAGILKRGCVAYTVRQPPQAHQVLCAHAARLQCTLTVVPSLSSYTFSEWEGPVLAVDVPTYRSNAALAAQLAQARLNGTRSPRAPPLALRLPRATAEGLRRFRWPGRYHVVQHHIATFYLDAAHTDESMQVCTQWFTDVAHSISDKILMYSNTPDRTVSTQFNYLQSIPFSQVFFVAPSVYRDTTSRENRQEFDQMHRDYVQLWSKADPGAAVEHLQCVDDAFSRLKKRTGKPSVLITGSIYLIGAVLSVIDPTSVL